MSKPKPVTLNLDLIFDRVNKETDPEHSIPPLAPIQVTPAPTPSEAPERKNHVYHFIVENGAGTYITNTGSLDQARAELLRKYSKVLSLEKVSK